MSTDEPIRGRVAKILNTRELVINRGSMHRVTKGMVFAILDAKLEEVEDPETGQSIGSLERPKTYVKVVEVQEKFCIAQTFRSRMTGGSTLDLTGIASLFTPRRRVYDTLRTDEVTWEDLDEEQSFVKIGDPAKETQLPQGADTVG